ncbi:MAG TPA: phage tail protein [Pyrinomonadaceae bacterium]|nr:phage tail protein [Pyrinomonadaceae bacterium]
MLAAVTVPRPFALIRTEDQWRRVAHDSTALEGEVVRLAWGEDAPDPQPAPPIGAGLAFDAHCRLYHSLPEDGQVERLLWAAEDPLRIELRQADTFDLFASEAHPSLGDFVPVEEMSRALLEPIGLAVDDGDRLFVAEAGGRCILIYDLWDRRLLRRVSLNARPLDMAAHGHSVYALLDSPTGLLQLNARNEVWSLPLPVPLPGLTQPTRIAISASGEIFLLDAAGTEQARVVPVLRPDRSFKAAFATDIEFLTGDAGASGEDAKSSVMVIARRPGEDFLRQRLGPSSREEMPPLKGRDYDGRGIVCTPDGRIGFWTKKGFRHAVPARVRYVPVGRVTTFRLDSGEFHTVWGRLFLDACIPRDTEIRAHCITTDEPPESATLERTPPSNTATMTVPRPDLSPPMPALTLVPKAGEVRQRLHRRETGRELPWARHAENDPFETYEAPVLADPGRYLWVTLELRGNTRLSPRIRSLRVEYPTHDYLRRLPKTFVRDDEVASFLRRYLAVFEGTLGEFEARSDARLALIDPRSTPPELLPWLAGFLGLVLDERWPVNVSRTMIQEAAWLFRMRGTVRGLTRFLEIYTGTKVILIEKFRLRGMGGVTVGESAQFTSNSVLGAGFRVGGAVGDDETNVLSGTIEDAFDTHAHRFSVIIPAMLSAEQLEVVRHILEVHRPAHTLFDVCTLDAGVRIGRGLNVGLTSIIGGGAGFSRLQLGNSLLGRDAIIGRPETGTHIGGSRLGTDSRVG